MNVLKKNFFKLTPMWLLGLFAPVASFAAEGATSGGSWGAGLAAGLGMGLAVLGAGTAQGKIAAAFMEGVSRNPGAVGAMRTFLILALIFAETLVLFTLLIALMLVGKA